MKILIAIDSMKGSLSSAAAGEAARRGCLTAAPAAEVTVLRLADGGEGTVRALAGEDATLVTATVTGPLGAPTVAEYAILADKTAVIEMAAAAGLPLLRPEERNPLYTTTYGVGELIADALSRGCRRYLIGIGGSATCDGGAGMLQALGFGLFDQSGNPIARGAHGLLSLHTVDTSRVPQELFESNFHVACDVRNPLCGAHGAAAVFAPQKGARPEDIPTLDAALAHFAAVVAEARGEDLSGVAGAGAAGGLGFALLTLLCARLSPGVETVIDMIGLREALRDTDLVLTGEGRLDGQTAFGKAPVGVARAAKERGIPVVAIGGSVSEDAAPLHECGIDACFPIIDSPCTLTEAMDGTRAKKNIERTAREITRLYLAAHQVK